MKIFSTAFATQSLFPESFSLHGWRKEAGIVKELNYRIIEHLTSNLPPTINNKVKFNDRC